MPKVHNADKNTFDAVFKKLEGIKEELKNSHSLDVLKSIILRYDVVQLKSDRDIQLIQADQKINKDLNKLMNRIDELIFNSLFQALERMKHELKHCHSSDNLNSLIQHHSQINTDTPSVLRHITKHPSAQNKIIKLEKEIAQHLQRKKQEFARTEPKNELNTDEAVREINANPYGKNALITEPQPNASHKDNAGAETNGSEVNESVVRHLVSKISSWQKHKRPSAVTCTSDPVSSRGSASSEQATSTVQADSSQSDKVTKQDLKSKQMKARELQLHQFDRLVKQLVIKRDEFHKRYPLELDDEVKKPYGAACQLVQRLMSYSEMYKEGIIDINEFKEQATHEIREQRKGVLSEHRGYKELMANILLALGTLGIGYVIAALFTQSFSPIKLNTSTVNQLDETLNAVEQTEQTSEARLC
ncbi:hypothetical protein Lmor_2313 [Legionella moravica]|uniref:Uncharacterized protein n=1 Tax=Legionella moravica TaxID=39962 RepID=A0A378JWQ7_9GAMM|nr:hypothetical protein [Legionella moravica]KTD32375.1 hypothetical protein Lmor_2313 [Legionella moravica]STX62470.1 Uncharacterised protein [Legionella moravica]